MEIDLENVVTNSGSEELVLNQKTFKDDVIVNGNLVFNGLVNGVNISELCSFAFPTSERSTKELVIDGKLQ